MKKTLTKLLIILLTAVIVFAVLMPALNIHDIKFYLFILILLGEYLALSIPDSIITIKGKGVKYFLQHSSLTLIFKIVAGCFVVGILYVLISRIIYSPILNAKAYATRINVTEVEFSEIPPYDFNTTAIIDRNSSSILGNKVMGEMTDLVSQFNVSEEYSQIDYKGGTYRVTPLEYDGLIKYFRNRSDGIPGYIIVNTTTGETKLKRLEDKMRYTKSAFFFDNLMFRLRFAYPFDIFSDPTFEIDEDGNPYYICTTYTYRGVNSIRKVKGVILYDPVSGSSQKYDLDNIPNWVDRVYPESLVTKELDDYGKYRGGFFNSFITQEGVIQTSEGYNYISKNGDIWLYTGMTSTMSDESNVGFMMVDLRTHEAQYIATSGADEYSVMASAEGEVSDYGYTATFPVLVNIDDKPTYILSLKDTAGLVKMYALVDAQDYQQVYICKAEKNAKASLDNLIAEATGHRSEADHTLLSYSGKVDEITSAVIDSNTYLFLQCDRDTFTLKVTLENADKALFIEKDYILNFSYYEEDGRKMIDTIAEVTPASVE